MITRSADGVPIAYDVSGAGSPLVLVHGWSCDRGYWRHQVPHFAGRHRVVTLDLAGHGESGTGRVAYTMAAFGADVVAVLERERLTGAVLVGHSMGSNAVLAAARLRPDLVAGLVWVDQFDSLVTPGAAAVATRVAPFRADFRAATDALVRRLFPPDADPALVAWVAADMASAPPAVALDALERTWSDVGPVIAGLREVAVPVVAFNAPDPPSDVDGLARHGVTVVTQPGVGHFGPLEDPAGFNRGLEAILAAIRARDDR